mmetsp:Transcript_29902/g.81686  ORF Transcript_29902/g.81686 Transcript_29902/m.81686 type:complete len:90 (-) Transcript_29902:28-297(-)|eukprot:scaffold303800_cov36-Tisochrysis_lutea.AAC.1
MARRDAVKLVYPLTACRWDADEEYTESAHKHRPMCRRQKGAGCACLRAPMYRVFWGGLQDAFTMADVRRKYVASPLSLSFVVCSLCVSL